MCGRTFCADCGEELIHRDNRKHYESASAFGQIVHRECPRTFTVGDIDLYYFKRSMGLLRLIEHKQPGQVLKHPQWEALGHMAKAVETYVALAGLHADSGVYLIRGEVGPATDNGRKPTHFVGPQEVYRSSDLNTPITALTTMGDLKDWMHA